MFGGPVKTDLIWESVVRANASERRGTHMTKNRALVSGGGKKPYKQKGTGRPQVGSIRTPLWRKGGTVFGPQPRSYAYQLPKKVERGALRAALTAQAAGRRGDRRRRVRGRGHEDQSGRRRCCERLGADGRTLVVDVKPDENFSAVGAQHRRRRGGGQRAGDGARRHEHATRIVATRAAIERLQEVLG